MWRTSCEQVSSFYETVTVKDADIARLKATIVELEASHVDGATVPALGMHVAGPTMPGAHPQVLVPPSPHSSGGTAASVTAAGSSSVVAPPLTHSLGDTIAPVVVARGSLATPRRGKAPPVSEFLAKIQTVLLTIGCRH